MSAPLFPIGCVVALKTHPYFKDGHKDIIHISGEATALPPLMVVTEVLLDRTASFEEHSGLELSNKGTCQCKCIWFSLKSNQIEQAWLSSKLLRRITCDFDSVDVDVPLLAIGTSVVLKTGSIEVGKKKSTFKQFGVDTAGNNSITGLLSFCCPPMVVIGTVKPDNKEPIIDGKTGLQKRWVSEILIKCKYFNPSNDKLSEVVIPAEALTAITTVSSKRIAELEDAILAGRLIKITHAVGPFAETIIRPLKIVYKGAFYFLEAKDYLENKIVEIPLGDSDTEFGEETSIEEFLPRIFEADGMLTHIPLDRVSLETLDKNKPWRIKYRNSQDIPTTRTIYNPTFLTYLEDAADSNHTKPVWYIKANCILRRHDVRFFRIERITRLEVLEVSSPPIAVPAENQNSEAVRL